MKKNKSEAQVKALVKAMDILSLLSKAPSGMTLTEITKAMQMPKSTVYGLVSTMLDYAFIDRYSTTGKYKIGIKIFELGHVVSKYLDAVNTAYPHMQELLKKFGGAVHLAYLDHDEVIYIEKLEALGAPKLNTTSGTRLPIHSSGVGKVMLANLPEYRIDQIIAKYGLPSRTPNTITDPGTLKAQLRKIMRQGFAEDIRESYSDVYCIASPILDHTGSVHYAISICSYIKTMTHEKREILIAEITRSAHIISCEIGNRSTIGKQEYEKSSTWIL